MPTLCAVLITRDEEANLPACLETLRWADEIVVLDSGSTDATREVAARLGARVETRAFDDFASQKNAAVALATKEWVFVVDADERVSPALADEIRRRISSDEAAGFRVPRATWIFGARARFGGNQSDAPVRLWRRGAARFHGAVHEEARVEGAVGMLRVPMEHHTIATLEKYQAKLDRYTDFEAKEIAERGPVRLWRLAVGPLARFLRTYILQLGFLDGRVGLLWALCSAYYYFLKHAKAWEIRARDGAGTSWYALPPGTVLGGRR
ncbi:MAG: glycosyltransferase family 2 protein [Planctomycetes bacterium]|nr:glycosyltransferase family 2 protein [Planctomycetota bacterium]